MATSLYHLDLSLVLEPRCSDTSPYVIVNVNDETIYKGYLDKTTTFNSVHRLPAQTNKLTVEFTNKTNQDTDLANNIDKAVIVESITFNRITSPKFIWAGTYQPDYPEPWLSEQTVPPEKMLTAHNYLSWNGVWTLEFTTPIFTWIHQTENLGWIYD